MFAISMVRLLHNAVEFGQLVEKQHAEMRQADFTWPDFQPTTDQRWHRRASRLRRSNSLSAVTSRPLCNIGSA